MQCIHQSKTVTEWIDPLHQIAVVDLLAVEDDHIAGRDVVAGGDRADEVEDRRPIRRAARIESYAKRFAAKEACSKALGTGFRKGIFWRDMEVVNLPSGKPTMRLTGGAAERLQYLTPSGMTTQIDVSLTDEPPTAQAIVIISATAALPE